MSDPLEFACHLLRERYECHTVILYGSRAEGDIEESSDYDLIGIRSSGNSLRDARYWNGVYLDLFVYPETSVSNPGESLLKLQGGRILFEKDAIGTNLLSALDQIFEAGPKKLPVDELEVRRVWARKMLDRAKKSDVEGNYRRVWLLTAILEDYFHFRGRWYLGPKKSFRWLEQHDAETFQAFQKALDPEARIENLESLIAKITL